MLSIVTKDMIARDLERLCDMTQESFDETAEQLQQTAESEDGRTYVAEILELAQIRRKIAERAGVTQWQL